MGGRRLPIRADGQTCLQYMGATSPTGEHSEDALRMAYRLVQHYYHRATNAGFRHTRCERPERGLRLPTAAACLAWQRDAFAFRILPLLRALPRRSRLPPTPAHRDACQLTNVPLTP